VAAPPGTERPSPLKGGEIEGAGLPGAEVDTRGQGAGGAEEEVVEEEVLLNGPPGVGAAEGEDRGGAVGVEDGDGSVDRSAGLGEGGAGHEEEEGAGTAGEGELDSLLVGLPEGEGAAVWLVRAGGRDEGDVVGVEAGVEGAASGAEAGVVDG